MSVTDRPTTSNEACEHKEAEHVHGTHACYVLDRCRCDDCSASNIRYEHSRIRWIVGVVPPPYVDAGPVRRHLALLMADGMGPKRVAEVTGVPHGAISKVIYGNYGTGAPPSRRVRRKTAEKLLDCPLSVADGAKVDAREAKAIVTELVARGWAKAEIGRRVTGPQARSLQVGRGDEVLAGTLRILRRLLAEKVPDRTSRWGTTYTPESNHRWRHIEPRTRGVPPDPDAPAFIAQARGRLRCGICDEPLATHPMVRCA